jgi:hypothetical protein
VIKAKVRRKDKVKSVRNFFLLDVFPCALQLACVQQIWSVSSSNKNGTLLAV